MNHHFPYVGNTAAVICCNVVTGDSDQAAQYRSALYYVLCNVLYTLGTR